MIVDIGGGTTDIAVLSLDDIVKSSSIKTAGNTLNANIIKYIKEKYKLLIGDLTAEKIKISFANVYKPKDITMDVRGRNLITGLPSIIKINQKEIKESLQGSVDKIIKEIISILESTPPELSSDIIDKGIVLTGGTSKLTGLLELIEEKTKIATLIAASPLTCVVEGTGMLLEKHKLLEEDQI